MTAPPRQCVTSQLVSQSVRADQSAGRVSKGRGVKSEQVNLLEIQIQILFALGAEITRHETTRCMIRTKPLPSEVKEEDDDQSGGTCHIVIFFTGFILFIEGD